MADIFAALISYFILNDNVVKCRHMRERRDIVSKLKPWLLSLALVFSLSGCTAGEDAETEWTALQIARAVAAGGDADMTEIVPGGELYEDYVSGYYGLNTDEILDGAVLVDGGDSAQEVAVFRFTAEDVARTAAGRLEEYLSARQADFEGYMPVQAEMVSEAAVTVRGAWCAMIVLPDSQAGEQAFDNCFESQAPETTPQSEPVTGTDVPQSAGTEVTPEPTSESATPSPSTEPVEWEYSEERIIDAYRSGDWTMLHEYDRAILEVVDEVLTTVAPEGMSDYERELAIHDYIIENASYDSNSLSLLPFFEENPNNTNPYGTLIDGRAVCRGYSSTFQLFMDLIGVECITVEGEGNLSRDEHAWNMVRLDGDWYCVDVTWDDPTGLGSVSASLAHRYFNVTSEFMRETHHYWDETYVPEATETTYAWNG